MSQILATFSGKHGDILWALPTLRELSIKYTQPVAMKIMPQFSSLLPLLNQQTYIAEATTITNWICIGEPHGCQPWLPPKESEAGFEHVYHLTYRGHPGITAPSMPVVEFIAWQQGITLSQPVVPFIDAPSLKKNMYIAVAFNDQYPEKKQAFLQTFTTLLPVDIPYVHMTSEPWTVAAEMVKNAAAYVGDRSSNWVLANGVGQKNIFTYEPDPNRNCTGQFGNVFGLPSGNELAAPPTLSPQDAARWAVVMVKERCVVVHGGAT